MHIKQLKKLFDELPVHPDNEKLYYDLLKLDMADFKPIMEAIIAGKIDIEDTRQILKLRFLSTFERLFKNPIDARISRNENELVNNMRENLLDRMFGTGSKIIKENIGFFQNIDDYKRIVANAYYEETGERLSDKEIDMILPAIQERYMQELNTVNYGLMSIDGAKEMQLLISDYLTYRPHNSSLLKDK